jgi:hypothetical protein
MGLTVRNWARKDREEQATILQWADKELQRLAPEA